MNTRLKARREGFSLVEVIVAMMILTVGVLSMAAVIGYLTLQVRLADLRTDRTAAVQQVVEQLRAQPFDQVASRSMDAAEQIGVFQVWWTVEPVGTDLRRLSVVSEGPGYRRAAGGFQHAIQDTATFTLVRRWN